MASITYNPFPTVPDQSSRITPAYNTTKVTPDDFGAGIARGVAEAAGTLSKGINTITENVVANEKEVQHYNSVASMQNFHGQFSNTMTQLEKETPADGVGLTQRTLKTFDEQAKPLITNAPPHMKEKIAAQIANYRAQFEVRAFNKELQISTNYQVNDLGKTLDQAAVQLSSSQDPTKDLEGQKAQWRQRVAAASKLTDAQREDFIRKGDQAMELAAGRKLLTDDPSKAREMLGGSVRESVVNRIIGVESGGDVTAKNPKSSATGPGQFIDSTWLRMIYQYRPDIAAGKNPDAILALRRDATLSREMTGKYVDEIEGQLRGKGLPTTAGNIYLGYFLGPGAATKMLSVDPSTPVSQIVDQRAINANPSILGGGERRTAGDVINWAAGKMAGVKPSERSSQFGNLSYDQIIAMRTDADTARAAQQTTQMQQANTVRQQSINDLLLGFQEGTKGRVEYDAARQSWLTDPGEALKVLGALTAQEKKTEDARVGAELLSNPEYRANPYDKSQKDALNAVYDATPGERKLDVGADMAGRGYVPTGFANTIMGAITSPNQQLRVKGLTTAARIMENDPSAFRGASHQTAIEKDASLFRSLLVDRNMTPQAAVQKMIEMDSEEYKAKIRPKEEEVKQFTDSIKKTDPTGTIRSLYGMIGWRPDMPMDGRQSSAMLNIYADLATERFMEIRDKKGAERYAQQKVMEMFGRSSQNRIMQYPPEKAYPTVFEGHTYIYDIAAQEATKYSKTKIDPKDIILDPVIDTPAAWREKQGPVPYALRYVKRDEKGNVVDIGTVYTQRAGVPAYFVVTEEDVTAWKNAKFSEKHNAELRRKAGIETAPAGTFDLGGPQLGIDPRTEVPR